MEVANVSWPSCTFESCPQCFPYPLPQELLKLSVSVDSTPHEVAFRIGRAPSAWDSESILSQVMGILASEKLGYAVEYIDTVDEVQCTMAMLNCVGWQQSHCGLVSDVNITAAVRSKEKVKEDLLPDVFACLEQWPLALVPSNLNVSINRWKARDIQEMGPTGFIGQNGFFVYSKSVEDAWAKDRLSLNSYQPYGSGEALKYLSPPRVYLEAGVTSNRIGCPGDGSVQVGLVDVGYKALMALNYTCIDSWWLAPGCAAFGDRWIDECVGAIDDDWGNFKPSVYKALARTNSRVAQLTLGYERAQEIIRSRRFNATFFWWSTDTQYLLENPFRVNFPREIEATTLIPVKLAWGPAVRRYKRLQTLINLISINNQDLNDLLGPVAMARAQRYGEVVRAPAGFFQKLACDWIRSHESIWNLWLPSRETCSDGEIYDGDRQSCWPCRRGTFFKDSNCVPCGPGQFQPLMGHMHCEECLEGTASSMEGSVKCPSCEVGKFSPERGASSCDSCGALLTTRYPASISADSCICGVGTYWDGRQCQPCLEGMFCPIGSNISKYSLALLAEENASFAEVPLLLPGFYSTLEEPLSVFQCTMRSSCPGGFPGVCPNGRIGLACAKCADHHHVKDGECVICPRNGGVLPLGLLVSGSLLVVGLVHVLGNWRFVKGAAAVMTATGFFSMAVTVVMTFGVYSHLDVRWSPPMADFFPLLSFVSLDVELISLPCLLGKQSFLDSYVLKIISFPGLCLLVLLISCILSSVPCAADLAHWRIPALVNTCGFLMSALFVAMSLVCLDGFRCLDNPNGKLTLYDDNSIVCFEGGAHNMIMGLSVVSILIYPVCFLSVTLYACLRYNSLTLKYGVYFTHQIRFLVSRMKPDHVLFGFWWNARNFTIALIPVLVANNYGAQIFMLVVTLMLWFVGQMRTQCWRFFALNQFDTVASAMQVVMLSLFGMLTSNDEDKSVATVGLCIIVLFAFIVTLMIAAAIFKLAQHAYSKTCYDVFVSHHKADAALQARQIKIILTSMVNLVVFLDVDCLDNLDNLVFSVKSSKKLLIVMTKDILRRPWCAVEMISGFLNCVSMSVVRINAFAPCVTPAYIADLVANLPPSDLGILYGCGLQTQDLQDTYLHIAALPYTRLPLMLLAAEKQVSAMLVALGRNFFLKYRYQAPRAFEQSMVLHLVYNTEDEKQCSVAYILMVLFQRSCWEVNPLRGNQAPMGVLDSSVCVLLLSRGLVSNAVSVGAVVAITRVEVEIVTVLSQESFHKPDQAFFDSLAAHGSQEDFKGAVSRFAPRCDGKEIVAALIPLYSILAWAFSPQHNERMMNEEFAVIEHRAKRLLMKGLLEREGRMRSSPLARTSPKTPRTSPRTEVPLQRTPRLLGSISNRSFLKAAKRGPPTPCTGLAATLPSSPCSSSSSSLSV